MSLREKSKKFFEKANSVKASPETEPSSMGLRAKAELLLKKILPKKSLRQRAQELLLNKEKGTIKIAEEKPHKGLLERSRELLQKLLSKPEEKKKFRNPRGLFARAQALRANPPTPTPRDHS